MAAPPQAHPNRSQKADRNARIVQLAVAGVPQRQIATEVHLSQPRVNEIITAELKARVDAPAEELIALREARNEDLYRRAYSAMIKADHGSKEWAVAWDRCLRAEESLRKLKGLDAPEALEIALTARAELEADLVASAAKVMVERMDKILAVLDADSAYRQAARMFVLEGAADRLDAVDSGAEFTDTAEVPRPQLAITAGSGAAGTAGSAESPSDEIDDDGGPSVPHPRRKDAASTILEQARALLEEDEDGEDEEDDQG